MEKESLPPGIIKVPKPLTAEEMAADAKKRLSLINQEFAKGLEFVTTFSKSVSFFGSSMLPEASPHYKHARELGSKIAKLGFTVVTGGGPSIMEAANRGAYEAEGRSVGLNIKLPHEQKRNAYLTDYEDFYYFFSRKVALTFAAEAYLFFPGGYGTLNEFFEIVMLMQTRRLEQVPIFLVGSDFWKPLDSFIREVIFKKFGMVEESALSLYIVSDNDEEILDVIKKTPTINTVPFPKQ